MKSNAQMALESLRAEREQHVENLTAARNSLKGLAAVEDPSPEQEERAGQLAASISTLEGKVSGSDVAIRVLEPILADLHSAIRFEGGVDRATLDGRRGFKGFGEFAQCVMAAANGQGFDQRLASLNAAEGGSTVVGGDGGFLVPQTFAARIYQHSLEQDAFLPLCDDDPVVGTSMSFPRDETTPWGSSGVRARWRAEGAAATADSPAMNLFTLRKEELIVLVRVTSELKDAAGTLDAYLERKSGEAIRWKTNDAIINGAGAGMPLGVANSPSLIAQAKETSQTADTINADNVAKMYSRCLNPGNGHWVVSPDAFPQLVVMTIGNQPIFTAPNQGIQAAPNGLLLGRPLHLSDTCQTLGDQGDIYFVDFSGYKTITSRGGMDTAMSMHLWFDRNEDAFRVIFKLDGQPWLLNPVTPPNSATTRSHFVALAARA